MTISSGLPIDPHEDEQIFRDVRRQHIIDSAVEAADRIIMDGSDGTCEETNYLTAKVAERFQHKALLPFQSAILKKDMGV